MPNTILFTIDVEDWFQVENFKPYIPRDSWSSREFRFEKNVNRLLDLLDDNGATRDGQLLASSKRKATFFILGWLAKRMPGIVREIDERGHEVASHGYHHDLCSNLTVKAFRDDLLNSKKLLEDIVGKPVIGYRAPSFSVNNQSLEIISSCGYRYDASYNSFEMNNRYGKVKLGDGIKTGIAYRMSENFTELPLSNLKILDSVLPFAGGGFLRLYPFPVLKHGIKHILRTEKAYHFYIHPWEIDETQPRVHEAPFLSKFRHYINIRHNFEKLKKILKTFSYCSFLSCSEYLGTKIASNFCTDTQCLGKNFGSE